MDNLDARVVALEVIEARKNSENPYDCLLLPRTASFLEAKIAYKRLLFLHPDKNPSLDVAHDAFKIIRTAFEEIKAKSQAPVPDLGINSAGNKWSAYTGTLAGEQPTHIHPSRGSIPSAPAQPPAPQQPTTWNSLPNLHHSKWGKPSTDPHHLLKVPETSTSRLKTASLPQSLDSEEHQYRHIDHRSSASNLEMDPLKPTFGEEDIDNEHDDALEIDCSSFYGKKSRLAGSLPLSTRAPPSAPAPQQTGWNERGASKWSDASRKNPLAELLRNPEAATARARKEDQIKEPKKRPASKTSHKSRVTQKKRQIRTRVVIESDSDDDGFVSQGKKEAEEKEIIISTSSDGEGGGGGDDGSSSSDGWESNEDSEKEDEAVSKSAAEAKSKALIQLLLAQQRSQAKHRLQAGAAAGAAQRAREHRAVFNRRGGRKRTQTRLNLAPITSK